MVKITKDCGQAASLYEANLSKHRIWDLAKKEVVETMKAYFAPVAYLYKGVRWSVRQLRKLGK